MFESDDLRSRPDGGDPIPPRGGGSDCAGLEGMAPGPRLAGVLARLDPAAIPDAYDVVEVAAACERLKAWADAIGIEAAAALSAHPVCHAPEAARHGFNPVRAAGQLLAPRLGQSPTTATNRVATAVQLTAELADTVTALSRGELDYSKAAALAVGVRVLDPPDGCADPMTGEVITSDGIRRGLVVRVERRVLPKAGARSLRQHRDAIARAVASIAPQTAEQRHQDACDARRVEFRTEADGMAWLSVYGPAVDLTAVKVMLDAAADAAKVTNPDDPRTLDQIRVDTLTELAWAILEHGHLPDFPDGQDHHDKHGADQDDRHGHRPDYGVNAAQRRRLRRRNGRAAAVNVTVPLSTLLGVDQRPGELEGYGPITAQAARRIAVHGHLAAAADRPDQRRAARLRHHPIHPAGGPARARAYPGRHLPVPDVQPPSEAVPVRPHHCCWQLRLEHQRPQRRAAQPGLPQREDPRRVAAVPTRTRPLPVDRALRPHL